MPILFYPITGIFTSFEYRTNPFQVSLSDTFIYVYMTRTLNNMFKKLKLFWFRPTHNDQYTLSFII